MTVRFTAQFPTVQYGYVKVEVEGEDQAALYRQFVEACAQADDHAQLLANPDGKGMANLAAGGVQVHPVGTPSGPPPWATGRPDEAQQFIPPAGPQQVPPQGWQPSVPQQQQYQQQAPGINCPHGQRTRRTGTNSRGDWVAHFCPLQKGDPNQCKPIFE